MWLGAVTRTTRRPSDRETILRKAKETKPGLIRQIEYNSETGHVTGVSQQGTPMRLVAGPKGICVPDALPFNRYVYAWTPASRLAGKTDEEWITCWKGA